MFDAERARLVSPCPSVVSTQLYVQAEALGALGQKITISQADELARQLALRNGEAQLRPDAGGLARGQRYAWELCTQSLYST
jgi:hypothetical protein